MLRLILSALLLFAAFPVQAQAEVPQTAEWLFADSDLPVDPAIRLGTLDNGMRYIIRHNATPAGQGMVQFWIDTGSIDEHDDELGYAHFVEHMAFNGSTKVPEGEMIKLLEREGLAFGADTNASTGFEQTIYKLDLPRNDPDLLDTALMLMRETASELTITPEAVEREKGVVLSEMRVRDTYSWRNLVDQFHFLYPDARFSRRFPVGTAESLQQATSDALRAYWERQYRPANSAIIVIGDFDPDLVEARIRVHFSGWQSEAPEPSANPGPVEENLSGAADIYLDPALPERVHAARHGPAIDEPDTVASRQRKLLARIGYQIINRRFQRLARADNPPFRSAGIGTSNVFDIARTTNLIVDTGDGEWLGALLEAQTELRLALEFGFTDAELAEQIANLRTALEDAATGASTRSNGDLVSAAIALLNDEQIPTTPESTLVRFQAYAPQITPTKVLAALKEDMVPLENPLIRFSGRTAPEGGEAALRDAWEMVMNAKLEGNIEDELPEFAYTDFGPAGTIASNEVEPLYGIRRLTFANGLKLNLKQTDLDVGKIQVRLEVDGGHMLNDADNPLATAMINALPTGGLGKHTADELQTILAGRSVSFVTRATDETFRLDASTTPRDLTLQLRLLAAALSDPGYRPQGEAQYRRNIENFFASLNATPESALSNAASAILSDGDPRFTLQPKEDYLALTFADLKEAIGDRLSHGALELSIVGDFDEQEAIDAVAVTLGALPQRESNFQRYEANRMRSFTADRRSHVLRHEGSKDQARISMYWPTRDDSDQTEALKLELLERVVRLEMTEKLREELGQIYSPSVSASQSRTYTGYGTFNLAASVDTGSVTSAREAILTTLQRLISEPVSQDVLLRARRPLEENFDNALKTNGGWMNLSEKAQSEPERLERFSQGKTILAAITAEDIRQTAAHYLDPEQRVEILALPPEE